MSGLQLDRERIIDGILEHVPELKDWPARMAAAYLLGCERLAAKEAVQKLRAERSFVVYLDDGGFWDNISTWLDKLAIDRCLAYVESHQGEDALALLEIREECVQRVVDTLLTHADRGVYRTLQSCHLLPAIWALGQGDRATVARNIGRFEGLTWLERYELYRLACRVDIAGVESPTSMLSPARPAWVPEALPLLTRERLGGGMLRRALARGDRDLLGTELVEVLPGAWLLYGDLDDLKHLCDYNGHLAGDLIISGTIGLLQSIVGDRVIRIGGDEVAILYEGEDGPELAEELCAAVAATRFGPAGHITEPLSVTISFGVVPAGNTSTSLQAAEDAMKEAKRAGKNRAMVRA